MDKETLRTKCFFCSLEIVEKKSFEHIIPNSLLKRQDIKNEYLHSEATMEYSKIKVPAHTTCNNTFGSKYEEKILKLLDEPERVYKLLRDGTDSFNEEAILRTWMTKVFYGLFYNNFLKSEGSSLNDSYLKMITSQNFKKTQEAYKTNSTIDTQSSILVFKTSSKEFNLITYILPETLMIQLNGIVLILCIDDDYLIKDYYQSNNSLGNFTKYLAEEERKPGFSTALFALSDIISVRINSLKFLRESKGSSEDINFPKRVASTRSQILLDLGSNYSL